MDDFDGLWYDCENSNTPTAEEQVRMEYFQRFFQYILLLYTIVIYSAYAKENAQNTCLALPNRNLKM